MSVDFPTAYYVDMGRDIIDTLSDVQLEDAIAIVARACGLMSMVNPTSDDAHSLQRALMSLCDADALITTYISEGGD
jgi:hypothetical protein